MADKVGFTQADRALRIDTPLGEDRCCCRAVSGQEALSQLFPLSTRLCFRDDSIIWKDLIGKQVTVHLQRQDGEVCWHGYVSRFSQGGQDEHLSISSRNGALAMVFDPHRGLPYFSK